MSRSYLLYGEFNGLFEDQVWSILCQWCGHSQIYKVQMMEDDVNGCGGFFWVEMGCGGGAAPQDKMWEFKRRMEEKEGVKIPLLKCWHIHPDTVDREVRDANY